MRNAKFFEKLFSFLCTGNHKHKHLSINYYFRDTFTHDALQGHQLKKFTLDSATALFLIKYRHHPSDRYILYQLKFTFHFIL